MKRVIFKKIVITNFLSVGKESLELEFNSGITLITGDNRDKGGRNGVGKSSVIESLYWVLFGNTIRDIKRDKIIHNQTGKDCTVVLNFEIVKTNQIDNYTLIRKAEPNKIELYCNNVDITRSSMPKTDELVKELIGANEEVFQNAVIMTANNTMPFMAQKKVDKRKFVEGVLHLGIFGEMLLQVRADLNDAKKQNEIESVSFLEHQKKIELYKNQSNKWVENKNQKINSLKSKIDQNKINIHNLVEKNADSNNIDNSKKELESLISKKETKIIQLQSLSSECSEKTFELNLKVSSLNNNIKNYEEEIKKLLQTSASCPVCKRDFEDVDKIHLEQHIGDLRSNIDVDKKLLSFAEKELTTQKVNCELITKNILKLSSDNKIHEKELNSLNLISQQIDQLEKRNEEILLEIKELNDEPDQFLSLIKDSEHKTQELENKISDIQQKINILESAKFIVSEEGVKTYIIKKMLKVLNSKLNFYLQALEAPCKCEFNEMFEETIFNDRGVECSYFNFSGGERKRIDLAILFMFQDLLRMQAGISFSLSIYDELFDSAVDEKGIEKILNILKNRVETYQENIYIVSHNKAADKAGVDQVILLEKQDGVTKILK